jgi:hypothetical protein
VINMLKDRSSLERLGKERMMWRGWKGFRSAIREPMSLVERV